MPAPMTRSPDPAEHALSPQTREMLAALPQNNVFRALAHADAAFPPLMELTASLWNDAVLDGELLVGRPDETGVHQPAAFNDLQQRLNRKTATPALIIGRTLVHHSSFGLGLAIGAMVTRGK